METGRSPSKPKTPFWKEAPESQEEKHPPQAAAFPEEAKAAQSAAGDESDGDDLITITDTVTGPQRPSDAPLETHVYIGNAFVQAYSSTGASLPSLRLNAQDVVTIVRNKPSKTTSKKTQGRSGNYKDNILLTFRNPKGFEVGRVAESAADWMAKALDLEIVVFHAQVVSCPVPMRLNGDIYLSVDIYLHKSAFFRLEDTISLSEQSERHHWDQTQPTDSERKLQNRKKSLNKIFKVTNVKPVKSNQATNQQKSRKELEKDATVLQHNKGKKHATSDEEGQDVISEEALNVVYARAVKSDSTLSEMDPNPFFELSLRPYQKQALSWLHSMEHYDDTKKASSEESIHPLWDEYNFPAEPGGVVTGNKFYYNPYSGELSLEFPKASSNVSGGILADEMGLGKTIMMSALILTSGSPLEEPGDVHDESECDTGDDHNGSYRPSKRLRTSSSSSVDSNSNSAGEDSTATLVIAPVTLLSQWKEELIRASGSKLFVAVFHGNSKDIRGADVVLTSYGTLLSEFNRQQSSVLYSVEWRRCILDEAHVIKSRTANISKACYALSANYRWCLTGTPIVNRLEDLFSLLHFLRFAPWGIYSFFRTFVTVPFENADPKALEVIQVILESILLRREKNMKDADGNPIVALPKKHVQTVRLELSDQERIIYTRIYENARAKFQSYSRSGTISHNVTSIFALLMRLRQAVLHPLLVAKDLPDYVKNSEDNDQREELSIQQLIASYSASGDASFAEQVMQSIMESKNEDVLGECCICLDNLERPFHLPCMHTGCKSCILGWIESQSTKGEEARCPICNAGPLNERDLFEIVRKPKQSEQKTDTSNSSKFFKKLEPPTNSESEASSLPPSTPPRPSTPTSRGNTEEMSKQQKPPPCSPSKSVDFVLKRNTFKSSSKLDALSDSLLKIRAEEENFHCIVFSQFTSFMDLIERVLTRDGLNHLRLDGSLSQKKRVQILQKFHKSKQCVLVISLKAGGVGLNLTKANRVFLCDVWWNEAIEQQAIDRVHRFGQEREVHVTRFVINDTIEERMIKLQERKTAIIQAGLGGGKLGKEEFELIFG